jgi:hypothetical protein
VLEKHLPALLAGRRTLEETLRQSPEAAAVQAELKTALLVNRLLAEMPDTAVRDLEQRLRARAARRGGAGRVLPAARRLPQISRWAAVLLIALFVGLGAGGGTVAASAGSLPGDPLYGIKRAWEQVVALVATLLGRAEDMALHLARVRFAEWLALNTAGSTPAPATTDLILALENAIRQADSTTTPQLVTFMLAAENALQSLPPAAQQQPGYDRVAQLLQPDFDAQGGLIVPLPRLLPTPAPALPAATATLPPTIAPTGTLPPTGTPTATLPPTPTLPPPTATSRIPATATRTPAAPTASPTATLPTATLPPPTATWTPLPLGVITSATPVTLPTLGPVLPSVTPVLPPLEVTLRIRETQAAVYATQTAIAAGTGEPTPTPDTAP